MTRAKQQLFQVSSHAKGCKPPDLIPTGIFTPPWLTLQESRGSLKSIYVEYSILWHVPGMRCCGIKLCQDTSSESSGMLNILMNQVTPNQTTPQIMLTPLFFIYYGSASCFSFLAGIHNHNIFTLECTTCRYLLSLIPATLSMNMKVSCPTAPIDPHHSFYSCMFLLWQYAYPYVCASPAA